MQHTENVRLRIKRLNPRGVPPGQRSRGWHPKKTAWYYEFLLAHVSRGNFIREYGREAWAEIPPNLIIKDGRRMYVALRHVRGL